MGTSEDIRLALRLLNRGSVGIRRLAAFSLTVVGDRDALIRLVEIAMDSGEDASVKEAALESIGRLQDAGVISNRRPALGPRF